MMNRTMAFSTLWIFCLFTSERFISRSWHEISTAQRGSRQKGKTAYIDFERGVQSIDDGDFDLALDFFRDLIDRYPDRPVGYFGMMGVYQTIMRDYRNTEYEAVYDSLLDLTIHKGEETLERDRRDVYARFFLGGAYGFRGLLNVRKRKWVSAFQDGLKGLVHMERVLEMEPTLYDANYGLGMYHYGVASKGRKAGLAVILRNWKHRGIQEIWTAVRHGSASHTSGRYALMAVYFDDEAYEKSWAINDELFREYPLNPSCLYMRGRIAEQTERLSEALEAYTRLLRRVRESPFRRPGHETDCLAGIARVRYRMNDKQGARRALDEAFRLAETREPDKELEGPLEDFSQIVEGMEQLAVQLRMNL